MNITALASRSALYFWRTNLAVALAAAVGTATLTGALLVGDSMRGSLRDLALNRLGRIDYALIAPTFFRADLADRLAKSLRASDPNFAATSLILLPASVTHADRQTRANRVNLFGVTKSFDQFDGTHKIAQHEGLVIGRALADELGAKIGDALLIRTSKPGDAPIETLLGRRDDTTAAMRLEVKAIVEGGIAGFDPSPKQSSALNAFVPLAQLQRTLQKPEGANAIVLAFGGVDLQDERQDRRLEDSLRNSISLADLGLSVRFEEERNYASLESSQMLLSPAIVLAANQTAASAKLAISPVVAYLANSISVETQKEAAEAKAQRRAVPYSTVVGIPPDFRLDELIRRVHEDHEAELRPGQIVLNEWTARELDARPGDRITLEYYVTGDFGKLETRRETFTLLAIAPMIDEIADPGFVPQYPGITDAESVTDWDPPFPMDLKKITDRDEVYWKKWRTAPKAFITLDDARRLWSHHADRFGEFTSIRLKLLEIKESVGALGEVAESLSARIASFADFLNQRLNPADFGLIFDPIRRRALQSSQGSTDFGVLFLSFSFFLIASAAMLVALMFRLSVERRASQIGLLHAQGFSPRSVSQLFLIEGIALALIGAIVGTIAARIYAELMILELQSRWVAAVNTTALQLHTRPQSFLVGGVSGIFIAAASMGWSLRGLVRLSPRALLSGTVTSPRKSSKRQGGSLATIVAAILMLVAIVQLVYTARKDAQSQAIGFFLAAFLLLLAAIIALGAWFGKSRTSVIHQAGPAAGLRLGIRNGPRHKGRSLMTVALIACATFLIAALESMRLQPDSTQSHQSGTGGFNLLAESTVPTLADLNDSASREEFGLANVDFAQTRFHHFRVQPGDDASCLNLYTPAKPRILGVPPSMIERGGFRIAASLAQTHEERENPWRLLNRTFPDGAIAAIADEAPVRWQMKKGIGQDLVISDATGAPLTLRFVALLKGSFLQSEVLISEASFKQKFPAIPGYSFFLADVPPQRIAELEPALERSLENFGFDVEKPEKRLARYMAVQNTYLSTFQLLGGVGLLLGVLGLAAVMLRNIWERRRELALFQALGFSSRQIALMVLSENFGLLLMGVGAGVFSALVAVAPRIVQDTAALPWRNLALMIGLLIAAGGISAALAAWRALKRPIIASLRTE